MKSTKYTGVRFNTLEDGTKVYYIRYKHLRKDITQKVGSNREGITPIYCKNLRDKTLVNLRLGDNAPIKTSGISVKTLDDVSREYFSQSVAKSKKELQAVYDTHLRSMKDLSIELINEDKINALKIEKVKEKSLKTKKVLSKVTINKILAVLSAILHYAKKLKYIKDIPVIEKYKVKNDRQRFLSVEEINATYKAIDESNIRTKKRMTLFVKLSLVTGGRLGSILSIRGKDINRSNRTITLQNHKTEGIYTAFIPENVMELIPPLAPQERLIDINDKKQIQRPLQGILNDLFNEGLESEDRKERVVVHTLRHTFASHLAINGTPIHKIMKLMDHSDINMTMRYAKLMPDSGRDEVENLYG